MAIKIQTFTAEVRIGDKTALKLKMQYPKGVMLRTAWRDAILHFHREGLLPHESNMEEEVDYSIVVTPHRIGEAEPQIEQVEVTK